MNQWNLTYLYETENDFEEALKELQSYPEKFHQFEGKLHEKESFKAYMLLNKETDQKLSRVYQYAALKNDLNKKDAKNAQNLMRVLSVLNAISEAMSFDSPEILSIGENTILTWVKEEKDLQEFRFPMEKLFHGNKHVLDKKSEYLLSLMRPLSDEGTKLYDALAIADGKPETITLSTKEKVTVTQGNWRALVAEAKTAKDRKKIFEAIFKAYEKNKYTYAEIYQLIMQNEKAFAKARNYHSILEANLFGNNIPTSVYLNLVSVAKKENAALKKYLKLRQKALHLKAHRSYDRFIELASSSKKYSYEDAKSLFFDSIKNCPDDFQQKAHMALEDGFVDVYEQEGKRSGAYSSGMPDLHPYILLNYSNALDDVFTVAHEAGHSIHTLYAQKQPATLQNYTIFVAEIASTFNEHMLLDYFIRSGKATKEEKIMLLQKAIDEIMGTFYRQTLFAEYELEVSRKVEKDEPLDHEVLSEIMIRLYRKYYGQNIKPEKVKQYVWAYIPHLFHTPFYVYQYATSFAASFKLYKDVKEGKPGAFDRYIGLLSSGGSAYPVDQAKEAGVDFTKKETFLAVTERMKELVDELEILLEE